MADAPKNRATLKSAFKAGSQPTESDFADLIDGMLNQVDDGLIKPPGEPLQINAVGDEAGVQAVINFYEIDQINQGNPSWSLQLNPRTEQSDPTSAKTGFCIADGKGEPRLFINKETGYIGIGTITPGAQVEIKAGSESLVGGWSEAIRLSKDQNIAITHPGASQDNGLLLGFHTSGKFYFSREDGKNIMVIDGKGVVQILGLANISDSTDFTTNGNMQAGSLTIGSTAISYGGDKNNPTNLAGLLLTTSSNTEIAVNDSGTRIASLMYYEGKKVNNITIGRDMGGGLTPVTIASNLDVKGNIFVSGGIFQDTDFTIELCGSATESSEGYAITDTYIKVNGSEIDITVSRGLNVVILKADGSLKMDGQNNLSASFDVWDATNNNNITHWNDWANWVNQKAEFGDIVAVTSFDAIRNAPQAGSGETPGAAESLLRDIQAVQIFTAATNVQRIPYALLFVKGRKAVEVIGIYRGINAHLNTTYLALVNEHVWVTATLESEWVNVTGQSYNSAQFYKNSEGIVRLRGCVSGGTPPKPDDPDKGTTYPIFTLPSHCWPANYEIHSVITTDDSGGVVMGRIDLLLDGRINYVLGGRKSLFLDGITFSTIK